VCIYCMLTYIAVIGIFIVSGAAFKAGFGTLPSRAARDTRRLLGSPLALSISVVYVAVAIAAIMLFPREAVVSASGSSPAAASAPARDIPAAQLAQFEQFLASQPRVPLAVPNDGADVLIVKFNDYQCPPCRQTYMDYTPILEKFQKSHPGKVRFVTKDFPLEAECNTGGAHAAACEAAAAVRMARAKNRADAMEAWLFENQTMMSPDLVRTGLRQVAGITDFESQYPKVLEQVRADVAFGRSLGVGRTPTFFINGVKIEGGLRPEFFEAAIVYELQRAQAKP
jgi:protein-disulfide isomerase